MVVVVVVVVTVAVVAAARYGQMSWVGLGLAGLGWACAGVGGVGG